VLEESDGDVREAPPRKKRRSSRKRRYVDEDRDQEDDIADRDERYRQEAPAEGDQDLPGARAWKLAGPKFVLGAERMTSILGASATRTTTLSDGFGASQTVEVNASALDVSLLGVSGSGRNPFATPRVSFDYVFRGGFSLGGAVGYMVYSAETEAPTTQGSSATTTTKQPTYTTALFAPRLGVFLPASSKVAVWLRGGLTHVVSKSETESESEVGSTFVTEVTESLWDMSLDPQLVLSPAPHVAITLGVSLDIGVGGELELTSGNSTTKNDLTMSSYGVTSGLVAMF
jgi:hypothetical protein